MAPILRHIWSYDQFESEAGQVEHTLAHSIERLWRFVASHEGYQSAEVLLKRPTSNKTTESRTRRRLTIFAHYDARNVISDSDLFYVRSIKETVGEVIFVSNVELSAEQQSKVSPFVISVVQRDNVGFDFGAWRDCLEVLGWERLESYDELILANNSCYGPVFPFSEMFTAMDGKQCDFYGVPVIEESIETGGEIAARRRDAPPFAKLLSGISSSRIGVERVQKFLGFCGRQN